MINKAFIVNKFKNQRELTPDSNINVSFGSSGDVVAIGTKGKIDKDRVGNYEGLTPKVLIVAWFVENDVEDVESNTFATIDDVKYLVGPMNTDQLNAVRRIHFLDKDFPS